MVPGYTLTMPPFAFMVWDFAKNIAAAEPAPVSYWIRKEVYFCFFCNELISSWQEAEDRGVLYLYPEEEHPPPMHSLQLWAKLGGCGPGVGSGGRSV